MLVSSRTRPLAIAPTAGVCRCRHCHRTPLLGERVYLYSEDVVCELCRAGRRRDPDGSVLVRSADHHLLVRARPRAA